MSLWIRGRRGSAPPRRSDAPASGSWNFGRRLSLQFQFPGFLPSPPRPRPKPPTSRGGRGASKIHFSKTNLPKAKAQPSRRADSQSLYPRVLVIGTPSRRRPQWGSGRRSSCSHLPPAKMTAGGAVALRRGGRGRLRRRRRGRSLRQRAAPGKSRAARAARGEAAAAAPNPRLRTP